MGDTTIPEFSVDFVVQLAARSCLRAYATLCVARAAQAGKRAGSAQPLALFEHVLKDP